MIQKREQLIQILGGFNCVRCGFTDSRALQIDHIHGNRKEMPLTKTGVMDYYIENQYEAKLDLQILCANCNWIKRAEEGETR